MRRLSQMSNPSRIFHCFSGSFGKVVFNLKLSNSTDSDVASLVQFILESNSAFLLWNSRFEKSELQKLKTAGIKLWIEFNMKV